MPGLTPHLWVSDMKRSIAFYRDVMGFTVRRAEPEAAPTFASLERPDASLMLSPFDESFGGWETAKAAQERRGEGGAVSFYIEAGDIQQEYERAVAAGARIVDPLGPRPWGQTEYTVADPDGFWWGVWKVG